MTDQQVASLVASMDLPGWGFRAEGQRVHVGLSVAPRDNRRPSEQLSSFSHHVNLDPDWDLGQVIRRVFAALQFLHDHWIREEFTVAGVRPFEAHAGDPPFIDRQKAWYVEHESAVRGY